MSVSDLIVAGAVVALFAGLLILHIFYPPFP